MVKFAYALDNIFHLADLLLPCTLCLVHLKQRFNTNVLTVSERSGLNQSGFRSGWALSSTIDMFRKILLLFLSSVFRVQHSRSPHVLRRVDIFRNL